MGVAGGPSIPQSGFQSASNDSLQSVVSSPAGSRHYLIFL